MTDEQFLEILASLSEISASVSSVFFLLCVLLGAFVAYAVLWLFFSNIKRR